MHFFPAIWWCTLIFQIFYFLTTSQLISHKKYSIDTCRCVGSVSSGGLYLTGTSEYFHNPASATNFFQFITFVFNVAIVVMDAASFPHCSALTDKRAGAASHWGRPLSELLRDNSRANAIDLCSGWLKAFAQMLTSGTSSIPRTLCWPGSRASSLTRHAFVIRRTAKDGGSFPGLGAHFQSKELGFTGSGGLFSLQISHRQSFRAADRRKGEMDQSL